MQLNAGQTAVITGAGSGIGKALADLCAAQNMHVVAADIEYGAAAKTVAAITDNGGQALALQVDVSNEDDVEKLADFTWEHFGGCHLLCNNAGVSVNKPLDECLPSDWHWLFNVNVMGIAHAVTHFVPRLKAQGWQAHIVNTASMAGLVPLPLFGPYVASKYAVVGLSEVLHQELAGTEIGVSMLCPGAVETRIFESERNRPDKDAHSAPAKDGMDIDFDTAYTRMITPEEAAELTLDAVRKEELYIATHPEWLPLFKGRADAITAAFQQSER